MAHTITASARTAGYVGFIMNLQVEVDLEDIAAEVTFDEAAFLIENIDKRQENWEFTEKMAKYFIGEMKKFFEDPDEDRTFEDFISSI